MTNEELKKKIVEVVLNSEITGIQIRAITGGYSMANNIADALIENGIGDVAEWKAKANDWKQRFESRDKQYNDGIVSSCKALQLKDEKIAKYKRRAEVAEKELAEVKNEQV